MLNGYINDMKVYSQNHQQKHRYIQTDNQYKNTEIVEYRMIKETLRLRLFYINRIYKFQLID